MPKRGPGTVCKAWHRRGLESNGYAPFYPAPFRAVPPAPARNPSGNMNTSTDFRQLLPELNEEAERVKCDKNGRVLLGDGTFFRELDTWERVEPFSTYQRSDSQPGDGWGNAWCRERPNSRITLLGQGIIQETSRPKIAPAGERQSSRNSIQRPAPRWKAHCGKTPTREADQSQNSDLLDMAM